MAKPMEEFLQERLGKEFLTWAAQTPACLPRFRNWRSPELPCSMRTVLRREYSGCFGIVAAFTLVECLLDLAHGPLLARTRS